MLYTQKTALISQLEQAISFSSSLGASCISLTGLLPSATNYCLDVLDASQSLEIDITTGHAITNCAMIMMYEKFQRQFLLEELDHTIGFLGLGSIGLGILRLFLSVCRHPSSIVLADVYNKQSDLQKIAESMRADFNYQGKIIVLDSTVSIPSELYACRVIFGATNKPNVLSANALKPGTIIIDDSAPHCISTKAVIERIKTRGDILVVEGGPTRCWR